MILHVAHKSLILQKATHVSPQKESAT